MTGSATPAQRWNEIVRQFSGAHLLQTWEWGHSKSRFGWQPWYVVWRQDGSYAILKEQDLLLLAGQPGQPALQNNITAATMILQRNISIRGFARQLSMLYAPKGPLLDWSDASLRQRVLTDLHLISKQRKAFLLKIDPDVRLGSGIPESEEEVLEAVGISVRAQLQATGWLFSAEQVQFRNTSMIDLTPSEDDLLANMKQKTRYNIRLAERKGVKVRRGTAADIPLLYKMYTETAVRDDFTIREENYYRVVLQTFMANPPEQSLLQPSVQPLIAEVDGEPVAAVVIFLFAGKAWYLYGMSRDTQREKMPNYLLQWAAIRLAKEMGAKVYDLWGAPDQFDESDPMWGVYRFKEGLGGKVVRHIGAWDLPVQPFFYRLYSRTLPRLMDILRRRQNMQSKRMIG